MKTFENMRDKIDYHEKGRKILVDELDLFLKPYGLTGKDFPIEASAYDAEGCYRFSLNSRGHQIRDEDRQPIRIWVPWDRDFPVDEFHALANAIRRHDGEEEYVDF